jgi:nucleotide-binding universal stress UspA family protein
MQVETILVPVDFSPHAEHALDMTIGLAAKLGTRTIHLIHVHHPPPMPAPLPGSGPSHQEVEERVLEDAASALEALSKRVESASIGVERAVYVGSPAEIICAQAAARGADLVVMGTRGRTGLSQVLLGSVAERTLAHAPCPVLTVRARDDDA